MVVLGPGPFRSERRCESGSDASPPSAYSKMNQVESCSSATRGGGNHCKSTRTNTVMFKRTHNINTKEIQIMGCATTSQHMPRTLVLLQNVFECSHRTVLNSSGPPPNRTHLTRQGGSYHTHSMLPIREVAPFALRIHCRGLRYRCQWKPK